MWSSHSADDTTIKSTIRTKSTVPAYPYHHQPTHDVPKRVYHHPPLTHHRSSPCAASSGPSKAQPPQSHRQISVSPISSCDSPTLTRHFSTEDTNHSIRRVRLIKEVDDDPTAGMTLCGGPEVGLQGIFISRIQENSLSEKCGLSPGDQILAANYTSFLDGITCQQAFSIICDNDCLLLNILSRHEALTHQRRHHCYAWIDPEGCSVSPPPPDRDSIGEGSSPEQQMSNSPFRRIKHGNHMSEVRTVTITMEKGISLGLMIRGGIEYGLGVYVTGIDANSLAEKARLKVGDQILRVNNYDFRDVMHDEAVDILKSSPRLTMKVKYVGRVPASSCAPQLFKDTSTGVVDYDHHPQHHLPQIPSSRCSMRRPHSQLPRPPSGQSTGQITPTLVVTDDCDDDIFDKMCHKYLNENQRITLAYYRNEYETKAMTADAFGAVVLELLDTPEKYSLMSRIRNGIRDEDLDKFDELIYKREEQALIKNKTASETLKFQFIEDTSDSSYHDQHDDVEIRDDDINGNESLEMDTDDDGLNDNADNSRYLIIPHENQINTCNSGVIEGTNNFIQQNSRLSRSDGLVSMSHRHHQGSTMVSSTAAYRRMMLRRHSSSASETPANDATIANNYITADERRWSIAAHEVPQDYQHVGSRARSLSGGEMRLSAGECHPSTANPSAAGDMRGSGNHLHVPGDDIGCGSVGYDRPNYLLQNHSRVRRHRSLPSPTFSGNQKPPLASNQHHRSSSFRLPSHRAIAEPNGRWRVIVKKSKPILGIAIEGGTNVPSQPQPRIISIHSSGAAIECGDLQVGHILLEVDGRTTANMTHDQVAQMIAHAYYNTPHKDFIEFLVREKAKCEFDLRRSSFMLLNNSFE